MNELVIYEVSMKEGFNNKLYLKMQSEKIKERISQFDDKLYLEFGGKLFDDYHASRVLPGFKPDSKLQMLLQLRDQAEIIIVVNAKDIIENKIRQDIGIPYDQDVFRLIDEFKKIGLFVGSVCITQYSQSKEVLLFEEKCRKNGIPFYKHYFIEGYPTETKKIISEDGFGKNEHIKTSHPLVVITAPGPGSGKMATCLSQLYHDNLKGIKAGYAKFETFPIWSIPLNHPVNIAYEAATADLNDVNMIDPFHLQAYGQIAINYNRDVEIFPVLKSMFEEIYGECPYKSPTDMGVNMAGFCIEDDEVCKEASAQEIVRRYFFSRNQFINEKCTADELHKQELLLKQAEITPEHRKCVGAARKKEEDCKVYSGAIDMNDGVIITGRTSELMGPCAAILMNAIKYLANIPDEELIIEREAFDPIQLLKTNYLGSQNPRLHSNEVLIALALSAKTNPMSAKALQQLKNLKGLQAHVTCDVSNVDLSVFNNLGINITYEAEKR